MLKSIVAVGPIENYIHQGSLLFPIGKDDGELLYRDNEDMGVFKTLTSHGIVIMGNSTYKSLPKKELKNRVIIVLTKNPENINIYEPIWNKPVWFLNIPQMFKILSNINTLVLKHSNVNHAYNNEETDDMLPAIWVAGGSSIYFVLNNYIETVYISQFYTEPDVIPNKFYTFNAYDFRYEKLYYSGNNFDTVKFHRFEGTGNNREYLYSTTIYSILYKYLADCLNTNSLTKKFDWINSKRFPVIILPRIYISEASRGYDLYAEKFIEESVFIRGFMNIIYRRIVSLSLGGYFKRIYPTISVNEVEIWLEDLLKRSLISNFKDVD